MAPEFGTFGTNKRKSLSVFWYSRLNPQHKSPELATNDTHSDLSVYHHVGVHFGADAGATTDRPPAPAEPSGTSADKEVFLVTVTHQIKVGGRRSEMRWRRLARRGRVYSRRPPFSPPFPPSLPLSFFKH